MYINFDQLIKDESEEALIDPRKIFSALPGKDAKYSYLRDVQAEVLDAWFARREEPDLVLKMNTGAGKTVVGLLILQSCLNEGMGPVVYVTPDNFLCEQVCLEAGLLGIPITKDCSSPDFVQGKAVLVITVHKLVNGKSVFGADKDDLKIRVESLLLDDVHACLSTTEKQFTLKVPAAHTVYQKLLNLFDQDLKMHSPARLLRIQEGDSRNLMLVPFWTWIDNNQDVLNAIFSHREESEFKFVWPLLEENLTHCQCLFSGAELEISPRCVPIECIPSFVTAQRRIYMTATLADDSILVTDFNVSPKSIVQPITPKRASDLGDRMIIAPQQLNPSVTDEQLRDFIKAYSSKYNVVVITPSDDRAASWEGVADKILNKENIHEGVKELQLKHVGLVVFSNKYDGIDLPGDACRLLVLDGLPQVHRYVDRYEQSVLNDDDEILSRQMQRIEQGMGRGVRANDDYCVVIIMGRKLTQVLFSKKATAKFSPATVAQMKLSEKLARQIQGKPLTDLATVISHCLERHSDWLKVSRQSLVNVTYDSALELCEVSLAQREAFDLAQKNQFHQAAEVIEALANKTKNPKIQGWLKAQVAEYIHRFDKAKAQEILLSAVTLNRCLTKPVRGITYQKLRHGTDSQAVCAEAFLYSKGLMPNEIVVWLHGLISDLKFYSNTAERFEKAIAMLGLAIGFKTQRPETEQGKGPDNLWSLGNFRFFVIECKSGAKTDTIAKRDADQLAGSMNWFRNHYDQSYKVTPILIHPKSVFDRQASPVPDIRIIDEECLEKIRCNLISYANAIGLSDVMPSKERLSKFFEESDFTPQKFCEKLTKAPH